MRSLYDNTALAGYAVAFNTTNNVVTIGAVVDTKGYNTAALRVFTSTVGATLAVGTGSSLTAVLQESDTSTGTFATANDVGGNAIQVVVTATTTAVISDARIEGLGLSNRKRYLRVQTTANFGGSASVLRQFTSCAVIELGRAYNRPVTSTASNT